jgi:hypothetical protein
MTSVQYTEADRDTRGFIRTQPEPRTLADLLPSSTPTAAPVQPAPVATRAQIAGCVAAGIVALFAVLYMVQRVPATQPANTPAAAPTNAPAATSAAIASNPPAASPLPVGGLQRAVVAYAAPDGAVIGPIEAGRAYTPTARLGLEWTQIDATGSGKVWIAARELQPDPALADLTPPTPIPQPIKKRRPRQRNARR